MNLSINGCTAKSQSTTMECRVIMSLPYKRKHSLLRYVYALFLDQRLTVLTFGMGLDLPM